ncbi:F-box/LRR-repeat protein At3g48880 [Zea mays]|uniref:F-box domain containing protein expressed n=1 Tax=Zea mays TaxID=4577 RepID=A0A1D6KXA3_MAIZE|nr:F-box/LRR-repeat protein At3g48880 [Zea mays]ONM07088.1 F-box domain containing protein expressed [Zea mays]|eukprot:XP_008665100.1 F-box/LRR-repeat protein At3g48880 [Zea mays]
METASAASVQGPSAAPWADMDTDCLVHVFGRLDLEDLAAAAPLVCRGWRRAAAEPSLWRALDLRRDHVARFMPWGALAAAFARRYAVRGFSLAGFLRICVWRARGSAEDVALPPLLAEPAHEIDHISLRCPRLRRLALPHLTVGDEARLPDLVPRWPLLEHLELETKPSSSSFPALAAQVALHCPAFASLKTSGAFKREDAAALARSLPRLRSLCVDRSYLPKEQLLAILAACRDLREFSARSCVGFDDEDEEVLRHGARILRFDVGGSKLVDELDDEFPGGGGFCDSSYVDVM